LISPNSVIFELADPDLRRLLEGGAYSDLTINCGHDKYNVHRAIVCPRSTFFEKACDSQFKEAHTRAIELPGDDPKAIELMLHYLYRLDYPQQQQEPQQGTHSSSPGVGADLETSIASSKKQRKMLKAVSHHADRKIPKTSNLLIHAKMYALGEKYDIQGLKDLALGKFLTEVEFYWDTDDFIKAFEEVFTSTVEEDRGLRNACVDIIAQHVELLDRTQLQDVVKRCDVAFELMMRFRSKRRDW